MKKPLQETLGNLFLLSKVFGLEPELLTWYASQPDRMITINEALREYQINHCLLHRDGWKYQIKTQYQLYVTDKYGIEYVCDINFDKFTAVEQFLQTFLIHESGGEWITRIRLLFSKTSGED